MFISDKPRPIDFYKDDAAAITTTTTTASAAAARDMIIDVTANQMILADTTTTSDEEIKTASAASSAPKKRAETWVQDETRVLIALRREMDGLFNTSKSNKHLWAQISAKMRDKGFDRSPTMCTDKWRNLLKEFKKAKHGHDRGNGGASGKMLCYKEIEEILRERSKKAMAAAATGAVQQQYKSPGGGGGGAKVDSFMQFADKGFEDTSISFGSVEASGRPALNLERRLDHDGHPLAITAADAVGTSGVPPWNWRETPGNGGDGQSYGGRVITVKFGDYTRRIGIDGSADAIKEAIRSAFRLRTRRAFWLEDEEQIIRSLDRDMPIGNYTLHLDEGLAIKVCHYDESDQLPVHTEEKIFYTEDDYRDFLGRRGWSCLREFDGYRNIDNMDDLQPGALYRGVR